MRRRPAAALLALALTAAVAGCSGSSGAPTTLPSTPPASSTTPPPSPVATYTAPPATLPTTPVSLTTQPPPWLPPAVVNSGATSADHVTAAGLPFAEEMLQVHYHAHLDINVDGKAVAVAQYIGFVVQGSNVQLAPLHTHDTTGIVHIENSVPATFVLGQFFIEWGVRFTATCLGAYCTGHGKELAVFVDGKRYQGDPTRLVLKKHQEIAVEYGRVGQLPQPPSSYAFPAGL